jgi:hypothetical protein
VRLRTLALCGLLCLLGSEVHAQANQLSFPQINARPGEERTIPLSGTFTGGMSGLVMTVLFNPSVIQVLDVSTGTLTEDFTLQSSVNSGRLTIAMAAAQPITTVFPEWILDLQVRVIGVPGAVTGLDIVSVVMNEGAASAATVDGSLTVIREASILGWVLYYADLQAVPNVVLSGTGEAVVDATTDTDGRYQIGPTPVGDYEVTMSRANGSLAAVDALDAADILRHLIGALTLSEGQQFAADVSGNGIIGTTDAGLILRFLVGLESSFPAGDFWQFEPEVVQFQPLIQDEFRNFTAYLMGDVDGSWQTAGGTGKRLMAEGPSLSLSRAPSGQNNVTEVRLDASHLDALRGGTVELRYDPHVLQATAIRRIQLDSDFLLATNLQHPGVIRVAFAGTDGLDGDATLMRILFDERGRGLETEISLHSARLNRSDLPAAAMTSLAFEVGRRITDINRDGSVDLSDFFLLVDHMGSEDSRFDLNGDGAVDLGDMFVLFDDMGSTRSKALAAASQLGLLDGPTLAQNAPNPFNGDTLIRFRTSIAGPMTLSIYDLAGQRIRNLWNGERPPGEHLLSWDGRDDAGRAVASGTYVYRLQSAVGDVQRKLLLLR